VRSKVALVLLLLLASATHALMRIYSNVPIGNFPQAMKDAAGGHFFNEGYLNVKSAPFKAKGDGITDDAEAFLSAIRDAYANNLVVYVPSGTYLISRQLRLVQTPQGTFPGQRKFAHILVGQKSANGRPLLKLKDRSSLSGPFIEFVHESIDPATRSVVIDPERHYNAVFRGLDIDMGDNPTATALSMAGAQYCVIEDIHIFGNFDTGIRQLPGSGGSATNVQITGGRIGILQDQYRPNPLVTGLSLSGQSLYGVQLLNSRGPLTIVGFHIESPAAAAASYRAIMLNNTSSADTASANLNLLDGEVWVHGNNIPAIENFDQDFYARNIYIRSDILIRSGARKPPAEVVAGSSAAFKRIAEYVFAGGTDNTHVFIDGQELAHMGSDFARVTGLRDAAPPADLIARHIWQEAQFPEFRDPDVVNIVRDYGATPDNEADDDAIAIQRAIDETTTANSRNFGKAIFIPRGHYHIKQPLLIHAGARIFGAANTISVIEISSSWKPTSPTSALLTDDRADSNLLLANFAILGHDPTAFKDVASHKYIALLTLRTNNTLLRDVQFTVREYFRSDNNYQEPRLVLKGNAGGKLYNIALDFPSNHSTGSMSPDYRQIAIRGTTHPIALYQPDTEYMSAGPQLEISSAQSVFLYAYKYEKDSPLLSLLDSTNIGIFGGSGNYSLYDPKDLAIFTVSRSSNYVFANLARKPDPTNLRDRPNAVQFDVITDGVNHIRADQNNLTLFESGELSWGESNR